MATWTDVVAIALALPGVEAATWYGTPGLKVGGKGFARWRTEDDQGLMLLCSLEEKEQLLAADEPAYYTTPHYDGYGSILVHLDLIDRDALCDLIRQAWRIKAPRGARDAFEAARSGLLPPPASRPASRPTRRAPARPRKARR